MSLIKNDARAAIPSEYSDSDPRNPNQLTQQSQANLNQMTADSTFDDQPKKRVVMENFEIIGASQAGPVILASISIAALITLLLMGRIGWPSR